jgi:hypothetical protein
MTSLNPHDNAPRNALIVAVFCAIIGLIIYAGYMR